MKTWTVVGAWLCCMVAGACSGAAASSSDAGPQGGGADAAVADAGPELPDAGPCILDDAGVCPPISWKDLAELPHAADHHTSFILETQAHTPYLYVVGGAFTVRAEVQDLYDTVHRARIEDDGTLAAWEALPALPGKRAFHAQVLHGGHIFLLAGIEKDASGISASTSVWVGTPDAVGMLSWAQGAALPMDVRTHATAHVVGNRMYLVGGGNSAGTALVDEAVLGADGTPESWHYAAPLVRPRSHHVGVVHDGHIYVAGGFDDQQRGVELVARSLHDDTGALTGWENVGYLAHPPWTPSGFELEGAFFIMGGGEGDHSLDRVRRAAFQEDGRLGDFEDIAELPLARSHVHQAPLLGRDVYSVGGRAGADFDSTARVFAGRVN